MNANHPPALLLADSRALDFVNSFEIPVDIGAEWLGNGEDFLAWLHAAELLSDEQVREVKAVANPGELDAVALQARAFREWFRGFVEKHRGTELDRSAIAELDPVNRVLARNEEFLQIAANSERTERNDVPSFNLISRRRVLSPDTLLSVIAKACAELVVSADFTYVKICEGDHCSIHFLDTTPSHRRRWCSMAVCGNRAKQAAHRNRCSN